MELDVKHEVGYVVVRTHGTIDESAGDLFRRELHPLVGQRGTRVVLDLSDSERINSMGVGYLVKLVSDANTNLSRVILASPSAFIDSVLRVTRLDRFFDRVDTVSAAKEWFQRELDGNASDSPSTA